MFVFAHYTGDIDIANQNSEYLPIMLDLVPVDESLSIIEVRSHIGGSIYIKTAYSYQGLL